MYVPLFPPEIPQGLAWDRTYFSALIGLRRDCEFEDFFFSMAQHLLVDQGFLIIEV
jgi:hypothetical protein